MKLATNGYVDTYSEHLRIAFRKSNVPIGIAEATITRLAANDPWIDTPFVSSVLWMTAWKRAKAIAKPLMKMNGLPYED